MLFACVSFLRVLQLMNLTDTHLPQVRHVSCWAIPYTPHFSYCDHHTYLLSMAVSTWTKPSYTSLNSLGWYMLEM